MVEEGNKYIFSSKGLDAEDFGIPQNILDIVEGIEVKAVQEVTEGYWDIDYEFDGGLITLYAVSDLHLEEIK
jgi:hypothetical protein